MCKRCGFVRDFDSLKRLKDALLLPVEGKCVAFLFSLIIVVVPRAVAQIHGDDGRHLDVPPSRLPDRTQSLGLRFWFRYLLTYLPGVRRVLLGADGSFCSCGAGGRPKVFLSATFCGGPRALLRN